MHVILSPIIHGLRNLKKNKKQVSFHKNIKEKKNPNHQVP